MTKRARPAWTGTPCPADGRAAAIGVGQTHELAVTGDALGIAFNAQGVTITAQIAAA